MNKPTHVFWITIDSVRYDHTSMSGYSRDTTPNLTRISNHQQATSYPNAIAHSVRTPSSVSSILTGLYPESHGQLGTGCTNTIPENLETVPERFQTQNYRTIGISENGFAGRVKGWDTKFDEFTHTRPLNYTNLSSPIMFNCLLSYLLNYQKFGARTDILDFLTQRYWSLFTLNVFKKKIRRGINRGDRLFTYVHFNDTHHPYIPPPKFRKLWSDEFEGTISEATDFVQSLSNNMWKWMAEGLNFGGNEYDKLHIMYDSCIRFVDQCVGILFDFLTEMLDEFIIIITADHGELLGEYGLLDHHSVLHDSLINVPLITYGMDQFIQEKRNPIQHIDIIKTILTAVGADTADLHGYNLFREKRNASVSQSLHESVDNKQRVDYDRLKQHDPDFNSDFLPNSLASAVRTEHFKLIKTSEDQKLYFMENEIEDTERHFPMVSAALTSYLERWRAELSTVGQDGCHESELDSDLERHLKSMGYM